MTRKKLHSYSVALKFDDWAELNKHLQRDYIKNLNNTIIEYVDDADIYFNADDKMGTVTVDLNATIRDQSNIRNAFKLLGNIYNFKVLDIQSD